MTRITVTLNHIHDGLRHRPDCCPVALAIKTKLPLYHEVTVTKGYVIINGNTKLFLRMPQKVSNFVQQFDILGKTHVKPIWFALNIPAKYLK